MTLLIDHASVKAAVSMEHAIEAMGAGCLEEAAGHTKLPQRTNIGAGEGWLRVGPVVMERSGVMGFKAMNLAKGHGVRYQVHLYNISTGALLAIMDAQHLTTLRTGATSAVATKLMARPGKSRVAVIGSGKEAKTQLEAVAAAGFVDSAIVYSRTEENREKFAANFRASHEMKINAAANAQEACEGADIIVAAVKSTQPVVKGEWIEPGMHINSVGTARLNQRELDVDVFRKATSIVVDTIEGVFEEAGDAAAAADLVDESTVHQLCNVVSKGTAIRKGKQDITLFKSVGTGIQDIALAKVIYEQAVKLGLGRDIGEFPYLK